MLGYLWSLLNPILYMLVLSAVFSNLVRGVPNYSLYVFTGILMWNMASMSLNLGAMAIVNGGNLLRKVRMPAWVFPLSSASSSAVNFLFSMLPLAALILYHKVPVTTQTLLFPLVLVCYAFFILGLSLFLSVANVFFRDVGHVLEPVLAITFYGTPIVYDPNLLQLPKLVEVALQLNPFTHYAHAFRATLMGYGSLELRHMAVLLLCSMGAMILGVWTYRKAQKAIIYHL